MSELFDPLRRQWVAATPEEQVRQQLLVQLVSCGFPSSLIAVEKELSQIPHLRGQPLPQRRADILCFAEGIHPQHALYPLLLIECKAEEIGEPEKRQLIGYNHYVKSFFVSLASATRFVLGWYDVQQRNYQFSEGLRSYDALCAACGKNK